MSKLQSPPAEDLKQREIAKAAALQRAYDENPQLREKADAIHHQRGLDGQACAQCIEIAVLRMGLEVP
jgi:hypothetical protein